MLKLGQMKRSNAEIITYVLLPTLLVASFGIFMTSLVQRISSDQNEQEATVLAENAADAITTRFAVAQAMLRGLAGFWIGSERVTDEEFDRFAKAVYDPDGPLVALEWVDTDNVVRHVYPREGENLRALGFDNNKFPNRLTPILTAKESRTTVTTDPVFLVQGFPGIVIYQPIFRDDQYLGMAVGVAKLQNVLRDAARSAHGPLRLAVAEGAYVMNAEGTVIYTGGKRIVSPSGDAVADPSAPVVPAAPLRGVHTFDVAGRQWTTYADTRTGHASPIAVTIACLTAGIALLCGFFLMTLQRVRRTLERTVAREHDFAALVSHQLRAPLTELNWMVDVVEDPQSGTDERASTLADMRRIIRQGVRTVAGLLTLSRIDRGVLEVKKDDVPVATLVDDALAPLRETAKAKRVSFHIDVPHGLAASVDADKAVEALRNVIDNAVKYGPGGSPVDIAALRTGGVVTVTVRDRGPGIPREIGDSVFDKATTFAKKGTTEGAGLGLYVSKMLLELMGGTIRFDTGPNGTTFVMTLPVESGGARP